MGKIAKKDESKHPEKRRAIILPTREDYTGFVSDKNDFTKTLEGVMHQLLDYPKVQA